jgi:signal transduction histidine kinase
MLPFLRKLFGFSSDTSTPEETVHINQEIYKKSVELSERNKTLLLLRKIDEIILSSVTDNYEIARKVASLLIIEAGFQIAAIFQYDKKDSMLRRLSIYEESKVYENSVNNSAEQFYVTEISISETDNMIVQSIKERMPKSTNTLQNSLFVRDGTSKSQIMQEQTGIKSVFIYPLVVRDRTIGSMAIALLDEEQNVSEYTRDLLERLVQVIGIALDNASLYTELQDANEKLKSLDRLKDEFVSLASHELKTPMTSVKSYLWMIIKGEAGEINEKQRAYLERAYSSTDRLIKLVSDMLNISRIESGRITLELQKVNMLSLVQEVLAEVAPRASESGIKVEIAASDLMPEVLADSDKIKEVLINLIGNSIKFVPSNGNITVSFSQKDGYLETTVSDNGSGISKDNIDKLFQKFSMLPESYSGNKNASGSGLGLYISKSIVELHNGRMWVTSQGEGMGASFTFSLPIFKDDDIEKVGGSKEGGSEKVGIIHTQL